MPNTVPAWNMAKRLNLKGDPVIRLIEKYFGLHRKMSRQATTMKPFQYSQKHTQKRWHVSQRILLHLIFPQLCKVGNCHSYHLQMRPAAWSEVTWHMVEKWGFRQCPLSLSQNTIWTQVWNQILCPFPNLQVWAKNSYQHKRQSSSHRESQ